MHTIESVLKRTYRYDEGEEEGSWEVFHEALRTCVAGLNSQDDIRESDLYHELDGSMADRIKELMPSNVYVMATSVMKELGLIRLVKEGRNTLWQVVDIDFFTLKANFECMVARDIFCDAFDLEEFLVELIPVAETVRPNDQVILITIDFSEEDRE